MRREIKKIKDSEREATLNALNSAASRITGNDAVEAFISDVLTESERITIGRRLLIANLILKGQTYYEINEKLGVSPNTFAKIRQWLTGRFPDYNQALKERLPVPTGTKTAYEKVQPFSFAHLMKKHPMHFLLFTLSKKVTSSLKNK